MERTLLTARSIEFDALVVAGGTTPSGDIKVVLLLQEAFRHAKALGAWGDGTAVLEAAGIPADSPGAVTADAIVKSFTDQLAAAVGPGPGLGAHVGRDGLGRSPGNRSLNREPGAGRSPERRPVRAPRN